MFAGLINEKKTLKVGEAKIFMKNAKCQGILFSTTVELRGVKALKVKKGKNR